MKVQELWEHWKVKGFKYIISSSHTVVCIQLDPEAGKAVLTYPLATKDHIFWEKQNFIQRDYRWHIHLLDTFQLW